MKKLYRLLFALLLFVGLFGSWVARAQIQPMPMPRTTANMPVPDMYVVMFRADWCAPCRVVEPNLDKALRQLNDPGLKFLVIDITDPPRTEISAHTAFDHQIVPQYNKWYGVTGFAAMIDADTKRTLGCVNMTYNARDMAKHIEKLKSIAINNQQSVDLTCPAPNN